MSVPIVPADPQLDEQRRAGLRRMRTLAVGLLLFAALVYLLTRGPDGWVRIVNAGAEAARGGGRGLDRRGGGVHGGCDRGLVRGGRALQAPVGPTDPAHRADPAPQGRARPEPGGVRR